MTEDFIPYEEALALKELGFDEPCIAIYYSKDKSFSWHHHKDHTNNERILDSGEFNISAPTFSQAFRWFRETQDYYSDVFVDDNKTFGFMNTHFTFEGRLDGPINRGYTTYEEAELECLKQLIKIVKKK